MANLTRATLRAEVYAQLAETSGFYTDDQINQWLADAQRHVCLQLEPLTTTATTTTTAGTGEYALPDDLISVRHVLYQNTAGAWYPLTATTYDALWQRDAAWESATGAPDEWFWRAQVLGVYPAPDADNDGANKLRIVYTYLAAVFANDAAESGLPEYCDVPIVQYAVYRARTKDRDPQLATLALAEYQREIDLLTLKLQKQIKAHGPRLQPDGSAYRGYYHRGGARGWLRVAES